MKSNFTKFGINRFGIDNDLLYSVCAYDKEHDSCIMIKYRTTFTSELPLEISVTAPGNFQIDGSNGHEPITAEEFWKRYKSAVISLFSFHQDIVVHNSKSNETVS